MADPVPIFTSDQVNQNLSGSSTTGSGTTAPTPYIPEIPGVQGAVGSLTPLLTSSVMAPLSGALNTAVSGAITNVASRIPVVGGLLGGILSGAATGALSKLLGTAIKSPVATSPIPNPMHQFATWTYAASLWWLDVGDYNTLVDGADAGSGLNLPLTKSYVIAEDSGLYPDRRLPTQQGLNYNIQTIDFDTVVGLNSTSKSSNMTTGKLTIAEPYGCTLLDSLVKASANTGKGDNYTQRPYMLQIDFVGYDDQGNPVPSSQTNVYRKRFPIQIVGFKIDVTNKGAEYVIDFTAANHVAHNNEHGKIPKNITVTAKTVDDFFKDFSKQLNDFWKLEATNQKVQYADSMSFDLDSAIGGSAIVYDKQMSLGKADPNSKQGIDLTKGSFSISAGTTIQDVINKVLVQSDFLIKQLGLKPDTGADEVQSSVTKALNTFKTVVQVTYSGVNAAGVESKGANDKIRNTYAKKFKYNIHQYIVYDPKHPSAPLASDSRPYASKVYNYIYTGQNIDILDFKINFDATFFTAVNSYTKEVAAAQPTASTALNNILADGKSPSLSLNLLGALNLIPGFDKITNLTPLRYKNIVNDQRDNTGMNIIANPAAQTTANMMRSIYTDLSGDMMNVDLKIVGDPTLLKQDDWLYSPSPTTSSIFNSALSQFDFAKQYGHIKMDNGTLIATLKVNTPTDLDMDQRNQGLVSPPIGSTPSLFSGQYQILTIKNSFSGGQFTQNLNLVRLTNSDVTAAAPLNNDGRGAVNINQSIQGLVNKTVQTVSGMVGTALGDVTTAAGDLYKKVTADSTAGQATVDAEGKVTSEYDATRWGGG